VEQIKVGMKMVATTCTFLPKVSDKRGKKGEQIVQHHKMWSHFMTRNSNMCFDDTAVEKAARETLQDLKDSWPRRPQGASEEGDWVSQIAARILEQAKLIKTTGRIRPSTSWYQELLTKVLDDGDDDDDDDVVKVREELRQQVSAKSEDDAAEDDAAAIGEAKPTDDTRVAATENGAGDAVDEKMDTPMDIDESSSHSDDESSEDSNSPQESATARDKTLDQPPVVEMRWPPKQVFPLEEPLAPVAETPRPPKQVFPVDEPQATPAKQALFPAEGVPVPEQRVLFDPTAPVSKPSTWLVGFDWTLKQAWRMQPGGKEADKIFAIKREVEGDVVMAVFPDMRLPIEDVTVDDHEQMEAATTPQRC
jgi:hypothetical protein